MGDARRGGISNGSSMYQLQAWAPTDLEHVRAFLRRDRARVDRDGKAAARVSGPGSPSPTNERSELAGCVASSNALNPATPIELRRP
jgi:hypothetical protein